MVRHGETDWNRRNRIQGWNDIPLNSAGMKQADRTARQLAGMNIAAVYSSPLMRALQTAERISGKHGLEPVIVDEFRELHQGVWEGLDVAEAKKRFPASYRKWLASPLENRPPGGESVAEVRDRVIKAYSRIIGEHPGGRTICIVSHKVVISIIKCVRLNRDLNSIHLHLPENAEWEAVDENFDITL